MNNPNAMNWSAFKGKLASYPDLNLQFQYAEGEWVRPSYHITEIKLAPITSVDCGGKVNTWTEVIVQLWEPEEKQQERAMKARKALSIVDLVEKAIQLDPLAEVKVEFGNSRFDTRQMFPSNIAAEGENLVVNLKADSVQCKALGRDQTCGTSDNEEVCCSPQVEQKPKIELKNLIAEGCCTPGAGCC
jgi:hypothetical protein